MHGPPSDVEHAWPPLGLRIGVGETTLRHVREHDLAHLMAILPDDYEHDPGPEPFAGHDLSAHRRRLLHQGHWRSLGTWSPASWCLDLVVEHRGDRVGVQSLEAQDFLTLRTVDSGSWLATDARGRGTGVAMRRAVLALAFDHLGARAAVSSARSDNAASLAVSGRLGYTDNGISIDAGHAGPVELRHMRLTRETWEASGLGREVEVEGVGACLPWFGLPA